MAGGESGKCPSASHHVVLLDNMDEATHERIRDAVAGVPAGKVASYGDIAEIAGATNPRFVGTVLKEDGFDLPWHRILRTDGSVAAHKQQEQLDRLRAEGVLASESKIDMRTYRWDPSTE